MYKLKYYSILLFISLFVSQCSKGPAEPTDTQIRDLTLMEKTLVESDNSFGLKLFQKIIEDEKDKNAFISPLSVSWRWG